MYEFAAAQIYAYVIAQVAVAQRVHAHYVAALHRAYGFYLGAFAVALRVGAAAQRNAYLLEAVGGKAGAKWPTGAASR